MPYALCYGVSVRIDGVEPRGREIEQLERTLCLLPSMHLRALPTITVGDRPARGGGGSASPTMPGGPFIRLNRMIFDPVQRPVNAGRLNYTLLHEVGHIIDWAFGCMATLAGSDPAGYAALLAHAHSGATQGPSEHFADAYADFFFHGGSFNRGSDNGGWVMPRGNWARDPRIQAMLGSPAFSDA